MSVTVLQGDARTLPMPDDSVDLIVTSPPYYGLRSYTDGGEHYDGQIGAEATPAEYVAALLDCTREWCRVLKPAGSLFVVLGDKYSERGGPERAGGIDGDQVNHRAFAAFPMELPRRCILGWSPPSGVVADPFGGTGTTALVADVLGRHGISIDMSADYCRLARWRTTDPGERARAMQVPRPPVQVSGQSTFDELEAAL